MQKQSTGREARRQQHKWRWRLAYSGGVAAGALLTQNGPLNSLLGAFLGALLVAGVHFSLWMQWALWWRAQRREKERLTRLYLEETGRNDAPKTTKR